MRFLSPHSPSRRLNEAVARSIVRASSALGGREYRRFVIVGVARTGSTLLLDLLNAHSKVIAFGEIFREEGAIGWDMPPFMTHQNRRILHLHKERPVEFLNSEVYRRWPRAISAVGFKLFYYHARSGPQAAVWDYLRNDPSITVIHIKRRNILEQYLSLTAAHATNVWAVSAPAPQAGQPIRLEPEACRRHFEQVRAYEDQCDAFFAGSGIETVAYEDLVADRAAVMRKIADRLGVGPEPVESRLVRQRSQPLTSAIANYQELQSYFAGTEWEGFFHEGDTLTAARQAG